MHKISNVIEGKATDITSYYTSKELNLAPDWKRKFRVDETSVPFACMEEWRSYRKIVDRLRTEAFPDRVELVRKGKRTKPGKTQQSFTLWSIQKAVLHRIALGHPKYRLPTGMSYRQVCSTLGVAPNTIAKLKRERKVWDILDHPEVERLQQLLGLW